MFNFCPSCASKKIDFKDSKVFRCPDCGFVYYHNIAAANGCLIVVPYADGEKLVLAVRAKEPAAGKLDLPGGFVDIGEGILEGLYREIQEEIGWTPPVPASAARFSEAGGSLSQDLSNAFKFLTSFSNVYEYKGISYNTCDLYFYIIAPGLKPEYLQAEKAEISKIVFLKPEEIDLDQLAFQSTRKAIEVWLDRKKSWFKFI